MIILIGGEKGGTGKTTIAINLAAMRANKGKDVLLVDTDRQSSASYWAQKRNEAGHSPRIPCVQVFGDSLHFEIKDLVNRYDDIILDAGGRESPELRAGLVVSEKVFIPIQASQFDVWTLDRAEELVRTARGFNPDLSAFVIINRASPNPMVSESTDAQELLKDFQLLQLANTVIRDRIIYRKAAREGLCVAEMVPEDQKATKEMGQFFGEVF
ncbi:AAA family ATPase [Thermodesulfobacteriota bacterium]